MPEIIIKQHYKGVTFRMLTNHSTFKYRVDPPHQMWLAKSLDQMIEIIEEEIINKKHSEMKVKIISTTGELPQYQTEGSAGMDLTANIDDPIILNPNSRVLIKTGISIELPKGYEAQIRPRSGLALKHGITVLNAPGTIDSDYRGEIGVILHNVAREDFVINKGDRIAQMVIARYQRVKWDRVDQLESSDRGQGGLGSTGVSKDEA